MTRGAASFPGPLEPGRFDGQLNGWPVRLFTLRNAAGMAVSISNYGAKIVQVLVPDRQGRFDDVVLGYDSLEGMLAGSPSMGAFIGRYAGRLENARFTLNGTEHRLSANSGGHCLHGGERGSRFQVFDAEQTSAGSVRMRYVFADGEEGFPGTLVLILTYSLLEANALMLDYEAEALERPTVASLTSHAFFNLNGAASGSALNHQVEICAGRFFCMTPQRVATGELLAVQGTPFDLRLPTLLSQRVRGGPGASAAASSAAQLLDGYDDCFLIKRSGLEGLALCASVRAAHSGRVMQVWSTEPALQFYSGLQPQEVMPGPPGKGGQTYFQQMGLCFEPQGYPNAPNCPAFASAVYEPGKKRCGTTIYRFGTEA